MRLNQIAKKKWFRSFFIILWLEIDHVFRDLIGWKLVNRNLKIVVLIKANQGDVSKFFQMKFNWILKK